MATTATIISTPRSRQMPTRSSGRTPRRSRWFARRLERASSSAYVIESSPLTTATLCGASAACSAKSAWTEASFGYSPSVRFHSWSTSARSAASGSSRADRRVSASSATCSSTRRRWPIIRRTVAASNRSVL
ncbi:MAG TPA: hypothetical protein VFY65_20350 [Longimicrobium sp.]|nr:hypothetical protein [Longimicrobium sp.]